MSSHATPQMGLNAMPPYPASEFPSLPCLHCVMIRFYVLFSLPSAFFEVLTAFVWNKNNNQLFFIIVSK